MLNPKYTLDTGGHAPSYRERKPQSWSGFYHDNYARAATFLALTPYQLWSGARIDLGLLDGKRALSKEKTVEWNESKTLIQKATLTLSVDNDSFFGSTEIVVYVNRMEVHREVWSLSGTYVYRLDVTGRIYNGANDFMVTYEKNPVVNPSATLTVSSTLELDYSGEEPAPSPPLEDLVNWVKDHPVESAGIASAGMVAAAGVIYLRKKRRR